MVVKGLSNYAAADVLGKRVGQLPAGLWQRLLAVGLVADKQIRRFVVPSSGQATCQPFFCADSEFAQGTDKMSEQGSRACLLSN
jgi:hypothetical protein